MIFDGHDHHDAIGQRNQAAALLDVSGALMVVGADQLASKPQFFDQSERFRFGADKAVGTAIDGAAVPRLRLDDAAQARALFKDDAFDARTRQVVRRGETGDAAADDAATHVLEFEFPDNFDTRLHMIDRSFRQDSVAEIENVARPRAGAL